MDHDIKDGWFTAADLSQKLAALGIAEGLVFDELLSTNTYAKEHANGCDKVPLVIVANCQTKGRGRFQRSFVSPQGTGIYLSLLIKPEESIQDISFLTIAASLAVVDMIAMHYPLQPAIKWLNDVYVNHKKVCGILCEGVLDAGSNAYRSLVIGIGVNTHTAIADIPAELQHSMTSLRMESGIAVPRLALIETLLKQFFHYYQQIIAHDYSFMERYRSLNFLIGKTVVIDGHNDPYLVLGINDCGHIILLDEQQKQLIKHAGEVSLRQKEIV